MTDAASLSQKVSRFVLGLRLDDMPPAVVQAAKLHLMDVIGVGLAGSRQETAMRARAALRTIPGAAGAATVWGSDDRLAAGYAAIANGVAAHCLDFDDTHTDSITHGSAVVGPVVLALGEELGAAGGEALAAFVAGWEVTARVGLAARGSFHKRGFHTTSVAGIFGAAAAAGRLLGLTPGQLDHALGLTGSQVSGISEYLSNGSSAKSFHPGWAAHAGIVACHMARAGMTGPMTVFEGRYSVFATYGLPDRCEPARVAADLGTVWESARISIKPYPCCHFAHAFVDCARALRAQGIRAEQVADIECVVPEIELPLICEPAAQKLRPDSPYAAKFSLPFLVAAGLIDGAVDHATFAPANVARADLLALAARVRYRAARDGETTFPKYFPGRLTARLTDGRAVEQQLDINYGNPDNPMSEDAVAAKFRANAGGVLDEARIARCVEALRSLERRPLGDVAAPPAGLIPDARACRPFWRRRQSSRSIRSWPKNGSPSNISVGTPQCPAASSMAWFSAISASSRAASRTASASRAARSSPARLAASARCDPSSHPVTLPSHSRRATCSMKGRPRPARVAAMPSRVRRWIWGWSRAISFVSRFCTTGSGTGRRNGMPSHCATRCESSRL